MDEIGSVPQDSRRRVAAHTCSFDQANSIAPFHLYACATTTSCSELSPALRDTGDTLPSLPTRSTTSSTRTKSIAVGFERDNGESPVRNFRDETRTTLGLRLKFWKLLSVEVGWFYSIWKQGISIMNPTADSMFPIARYQSGRADESHLDLVIAETWRALLVNPRERDSIAALLSVPSESLDPQQPPFESHISSSGLTCGEVLIAAASGFVVAVAKDIGAAAGKEAVKKLRALWSRFFQDRVNPPGSGQMGPEKDRDG
jgi:hypothetical protein